jgi:putative two-component system response regulator
MKRTIYVVDDVLSNIELVEAVFRNDSVITIKKALNGKELLEQMKKDDLPDLLILDLMMPITDGFEVLKKIKDIREKSYFPIIVLSALSDKQSIIEALSMGADDYVTKPFFVEELKTRAYNMLKLKERDEYLNTSLDIMESNLLEKLKMLEHTQLEIIIRLGKASEFRDDETGRHIERISNYVSLIAGAMGFNNEQIALMKHASPMHDIGKIGIPDNILLKPARLTEDEFKIIKLHTIIGSKILSGTTLPLLDLAREIAISHHERWDGNGYPMGLSKKNISVSGRIVSITDVFDALTSNRVYKTAWTIEKALDYIKEQRGKQFCPDVVDAFFSVVDKIIEIKAAKTDAPTTKPIIQKIINGDLSIEELVELWR